MKLEVVEWWKRNQNSIIAIVAISGQILLWVGIGVIVWYCRRKFGS